MDTHQHPDDERLAALAGEEREAVADEPLRGHVAGCARCRALLDDLSMLRAALGQLPDLAPHRPLELRLPESRPGFTERLAAFSQRAFAPVIGLASALLLVGVIGTGAGMAEGVLSGTAAEPVPAAAPEEDAAEFAPAAEDGVTGAEQGPGAAAEADEETGVARSLAENETLQERLATEGSQALVDNWPWNGLLGVGLALLLLALILRFALRPREA